VTPAEEFEEIRTSSLRLLRPLARPARVFTSFVALAGSARRLRALILFLVVGLVALTAMAELQATLRGMHEPAASSYDAGDLSSTFLLPKEEETLDALNTWETHRETNAGLDVASPQWIVVWFFVIDGALLAPAYSAFLALGLLMLRRRVRDRVVDATDTDAAERKDARNRLLCGAFVAVPALFLADELENVTAVLLSLEMGEPLTELGTWATIAVWALWALTTVKWTLAALIVAPALIAAGSILREDLTGEQATTTGRRSGLWASLVAVRVHLLLLVLFGLFLFTEQGVDVLRRWNGDWEHAAAGVAFTLAFAVVTATSANRVLALRYDRDAVVKPRRLVVVGAALIALGLLLDFTVHRWEGIWTLGAIVAAIGLLSWPIQTVKPRARLAGAGAGLLPCLLGTTVLVLLGLALVRASVSGVFYSKRLDGDVGLLALGLGLLGCAWLFSSLIGFRAVGGAGKAVAPALDSGAAWAGAAILAAGVTVAIWLAPWEAGFALGSLAVVSAWLVLALLLWLGLAVFLARRATPSALAILGFNRVPIVILVVVWALLSAAVDEGGYHDVRTRDATQRAPLSLEQAFERWLEDRDLEAIQSGDPIVPATRKRGIPLVFVAASGGGVRAAYWTAIALDCLLERTGCDSTVDENDFDDPGIFIASGVSGSSVGLAAHAARLVGDADSGGEHEAGWVRSLFEDDHLAPTVGWALYADLPNALTRADLVRDRAAVLEEAWERGWPNWNRGTPTGLSLGLFQLRELRDDQGRRAPVLILNGTSVEDGCRFNTSILDAAVEARQADRLLEDCVALRPFETGDGQRPAEARRDWALAATKDVNEFLCPETSDANDVRLSTAALLSARFPYVSPAARVVKCSDPGGASASYVVDGGYFDTSAASPVVEIWQALEPLVESYNLRAPDTCLVPVFIQLDNGYHDPRGPDPNARPPELEVPLRTLGDARNAREANARQAGALAFAQRLFADVDGAPATWDVSIGLRFHREDGELVRYAHLYPGAHPGTRAPLGWSLSKFAMTDLDDQLRKRNEAEINRVHGWFERDALSCEVATG
jgi:hypothetical protein